MGLFFFNREEEMKKYVLIGGAWPYANGSLHIGHIAGLITGDVIARYYKQKGCEVSYVSGSDCHGTPVTLRAQAESKTPEEVSDFYHREFESCFERLGFSYDYYGKTSSERHHEFVRDFHKKLYESPSVFEKESGEAFCTNCNRFLPDRMVKGRCPQCGKAARGDQCEFCGSVLDSHEVSEAVCAVCGGEVSRKPTKHLYLRLSDFEKEIKMLAHSEGHRQNAVDFTNRYIGEGLRDRALTRDIEWGVDVPKKDYEDKKIYIWAENVLGYLSSCLLHCEREGLDFDSFFKNPEAVHYYVHGKDNIPFHSVILPSLLLAEGSCWHLPDHIISSEFVTLDGRKISTSGNHAIWIKDLLERYNPDSIRFYFLANSPERKDADFTMREFVNCNNSELVGIFGNFINRTLVFIEKYFDGKVPEGQLDAETENQIRGAFEKSADSIEKGGLRDAAGVLIDLARYGNKYFDTKAPWATRTGNPGECADTLFVCVQIIANLATLAEPFIPFTSARVRDWLKIDRTWEFKRVAPGEHIGKPQILFERLV